MCNSLATLPVELLKLSSCTTLDKYIGLPGGVTLTNKNGAPIYSLKNFHGDTAIQVAATGLPSTNVMLYDPFGQVLSSNTFGTSKTTLTNASDKGMGWAASGGLGPAGSWDSNGDLTERGLAYPGEVSIFDTYTFQKRCLQ